MKRGKRFSIGLVVGLIMLALAACGQQKKTAVQEENGSMAGLGGEYVYVPTFTTLKDGGEGEFLSHTVIQGNTLYYSLMQYYDLVTMKYDTQIIKVDIHNPGQQEVLEIEKPRLEGYEANVSCFQVDQEGNLYVAYRLTPPYVEGVPYDYEDYTTYLVKYDDNQQMIFEKNLKNILVGQNDEFISALEIGEDGRVLAVSANVIYVLTRDGELMTSITDPTKQIRDIFTTMEEKIYCLLSQNTDKRVELAEIDMKKNSWGETYQNLPESGWEASGGVPGKILVKDNSYLYEYDLASSQAVPIVSWMDSLLDSSGINHFAMLEDGDVLLTYADHTTNCIEMVKLTKTKASELPQKEEIVLASLYNQNQELQTAILEFNRTSQKYKIVHKSYIDQYAEWTENTIQDGKVLMHADLISENPPDIIDLSYGNIGDLERAGVLEDLTPYLEKSQVIQKEDFVSNVLENYTYGEKLVTIPRSFRVNTLIGKKSLVGDTPGWTLRDMMRLAEQYPEAKLMEFMTPELNLQMCLQYNCSFFVDYETGTCRFDSPEFIEVLEFANRFIAYPNQSLGLPSQLRQNKVLLTSLSIYSVQEYQTYQLMFEEPTVCIGYPMVDGSNGVFIEAGQMYGISTKSKHKDGAWTFLEDYLSYHGGTDSYTWGFPTRVDELEEVFAEAGRPEYKEDENGQQIEVPKTTSWFSDWEAEIYAASEDQIAELRELIEAAKPINSNDVEIQKIINEEAQAYFIGQKSPVDVAKIIQSRVSVFVNENR